MNNVKSCSCWYGIFLLTAIMSNLFNFGLLLSTAELADVNLRAITHSIICLEEQ